MGAKIRRLENNLVTIGTGVIAFGLWSFIKFMMTTLLVGEKFEGSVDGTADPLVNVIIWIIVIGSFLMYLWLGMTARAEGNGKRKSVFYLVIIFLVLLYSMAMLVLDVRVIVIYAEILDEDIFTFFITTVIDVTRFIFLAELFFSSITLRKLRKQQAATEAIAA